MSRKQLWTGLLLGTLVGLLWFSIRLALTRIYQVDECQNLYMARVLATGHASEFFTNASLLLLGPLSWITKTAVHSTEMFTAARLVFLGVFWLNLLLLAAIVSERLLSLRGLIALVAAATLAPLWDYGFEIRHDNLILTGVLLVWWVVRTRPTGLVSYALAGAVTVTMLFVAVKTVVYVLPLSLAILLFPPATLKQSRWRLGLAWVGGAVLATIIIRLCYGSGGAWDIYLSVFHGVTKYSAAHSEAGSGRFWPWNTLARLLGQTPLLLALTTAACLAVATDVARRGKAALTWDGNLPELLLLLGALAALFANPTPFPYNLVNVVPYAFLLAFKYGAGLWKMLRDWAPLQLFVASLLVFAHLLPFGVATQRHLDYSNNRQRSLMRAAEDLTDPGKDPVFDGIGMVPTRPSIDFLWYLHSLNIETFIHEKGHHLRDYLAKRPAAVIIPSYRTDWLPQADHDFITQRYVPLADDFWVLGTVLPPTGGSFEIVHAGRYRITSSQDSGVQDIASKARQSATTHAPPRASWTLDGKPFFGPVVRLTVGMHQIKTSNHVQPAVVWVGPHLDRPPRLSPGDHRFLFVNWY